MQLSRSFLIVVLFPLLLGAAGMRMKLLGVESGIKSQKQKSTGISLLSSAMKTFIPDSVKTHYDRLRIGRSQHIGCKHSTSRTVPLLQKSSSSSSQSSSPSSSSSQSRVGVPSDEFTNTQSLLRKTISKKIEKREKKFF